MSWLEHPRTVAGYNARLERSFRIGGDPRLYALRVENYGLRERIRQLEIQVTVLQANLDSVVEGEIDGKETAKEKVQR